MTAALLLSLALLGAAPDAGPLRMLGPAPAGEVRRVVTLAPSLTDLVLALGAGERLVGVSRFDERPEVASLPRVGGFVDPSVEAVLALHPDLVLVQPGPGNRRAVEAMAELGAPVLLLPLDTVADVLAAERAVGKALGRTEEGERLARRLETARAEVRGRASGRNAGPRAAGLRLRAPGGRRSGWLRRRAAGRRRGHQRRRGRGKLLRRLLGGAGHPSQARADHRRRRRRRGARSGSARCPACARRAGSSCRTARCSIPGPALEQGLDSSRRWSPGSSAPEARP